MNAIDCEYDNLKITVAERGRFIWQRMVLSTFSRKMKEIAVERFKHTSN